jgi:hypothetical protein
MIHHGSIEVADICGYFCATWTVMIGAASKSFAVSMILSMGVFAFQMALWAHTDFMLPTRGQWLSSFVIAFHWMLMFERWICRSPRFSR